MHAEVVEQAAQAAPYLRYIPLAPFVGVLFHLTLGYRLGRRAVGIVACASVAAAFAMAANAFLAVFQGAPGLALVDPVYQWLASGDFRADVAFRVDALSSVMVMIVTGIGFLIHVYSTGYMSHEEDHARFFAYLNLFMAAMLVLVLADNLPLMFVGWEGVGLCSYLLIGFWHTDPEKASAGKKAFLVNRIGDAGFILGAFTLFWALADLGAPGLTFETVNAHAASLAPGVALAAALLLFVGATGKSAQIPLYVWLPDAMAGPTPVSALIHAATMVTAGVYMVARLHGLFEAAPLALEIIGVVGAATALMAATIGIAQNDIKKVLAYSTVSQLGYMFLALGVGAASAAVFHLVTHAFFKACLFLGAGSVIHALGHEQDMRRMGGLRRPMPVTFVTFLVSGFALAGLPPLAGFFSKDAILWQAWLHSPVLWAVGAAAAAMTAFYVMRQVAMTFFGEAAPREPGHAHVADSGEDADAHGAPHGGPVRESSPFMTVPLVLLAAGAVGAGALGVPAALGGADHFAHWLAPVFADAHGGAAHHDAHNLAEEFALIAASVALALAGIALALMMYVRRSLSAATLADFGGGLPYRLSAARYYFDEIYAVTFVAGTAGLARGLAWFDHHVVDGIVRGAATLVRGVSALHGGFDRLVVDGLVGATAAAFDRAGAALRAVQTGSISAYLYVLLLGVAALAFSGAW
jgi:NADH-quinone oxidoreductase subunit L